MLDLTCHAAVLCSALPRSLLPYSVLWRPNTMRWSMCSEELCFFHPAVGTFMGAGRVLPVRRGGSIFQKVLVDYQQAMERGEWAHIFPEGRVWQEVRRPIYLWSPCPARVCVTLTRACWSRCVSLPT